MTRIEWTHRPDTKGESWNLIGGCTKVSEGCINCYALPMSWRLQNNPKRPDRYEGVAARTEYDHPYRSEKYLTQWTGRINLDWDVLEIPYRWKKPRTVFVCSMADLFHPKVPDEFIDRAFAVMAQCNHHCFILLTKRAARMADYINGAFDRIAALLYNEKHEQRNGILGYDRFGRDRNRSPGPDMAIKEAPRSGSSAGRGLLEGINDQPMSACTGRIPQQGISPDHKDAQGQTDNDRSTSSSMDLLQRPDSTWIDHQSQERAERRQSSLQLRTSNIQGATQTCPRSAESESTSPNRVKTSQDTFDRSRCTSDSNAENNRYDGQGHCGPVQDETEGHLSNMLPKDMAAYLNWPLPNVWAMVTAENQKQADLRIPYLLQTPAVVRGVSVEPMLSPVNLGLAGTAPKEWGYGYKPIGELLSWVIIGCESGPNRRPMEEWWALDLIEQCDAAKVPVFIKQVCDADGRVSKDPSEWFPALRRREWPE